MSQTWQDIWASKAEKIESKPQLSDLMRMDGYDISCSSVDTSQLIDFTKGLIDRLNLIEGSHVLEVGCGAGAVCKILSDNGIQVTGIDYTKKLVDVAKKAMPTEEFYHADALSYDLDDKQYDLVLCHSVCHYFPDTDYMSQALAKMFDHCKSGGVIAVTDIHDATLEAKHIKRRKEMIGEEQYNKLYADLAHTFFDKSLFTDFAETKNSPIKIGEQFLQSESGKFKFNAYITK